MKKSKSKKEKNVKSNESSNSKISKKSPKKKKSNVKSSKEEIKEMNLVKTINSILSNLKLGETSKQNLDEQNTQNTNSQQINQQRTSIPPEFLQVILNQTRKPNKIKDVILALLILYFFTSFLIYSTTNLKFGNVARIKIYGSITFDDHSGVSAKEVVKWLDEIMNNRQYKGLILDINSPGGSAGATWMIVKKLMELKNKTDIEVVALIREIGTSGAYWIASTADKIFANRLAITGSVGVLGSFITLESFLKEHNITYQRIIAGQYKDIGSLFKDLNEDERQLLLKKINYTYQFFVNSVAELRNINISEMKKIATGEFFTAEEAKNLGLIDEFGTEDDVINYLSDVLNESISIVDYENKLSLLEKMMNLFATYNYFAGEKFATGFLNTLQKSQISLE